MRKEQIALQIWTVRDHLERDLAGAMAQLADIGYRAIEFGDLPVPPDEFRRILDDLGMKAIARHISVGDCLANLNRVLEESLAVGGRDFVCPGLSGELRGSLAGYHKFAEILNDVSKALAQHGVRLSYHNHHFEFDLHDGERGYDHLFDRLLPSVNAELDVYWLARAGRDVIEDISVFSGRAPLIHMKDMEPGDDGFYAEVGEGVLDIPGIVAAADAAGAEWYIVEQDESRRDTMESVRISYDYLAHLCEE
jgi:sugar phosphate isomerase/epimerase